LRTPSSAARSAPRSGDDPGRRARSRPDAAASGCERADKAGADDGGADACEIRHFPRSDNRIAPIHRQARAGHECGCGRGKEQHRPVMSSGLPQRPSGVRDSNTRDECFGSCRARADCSVTMKPGAIALTRMPSSAQAMASDLVSCSNACLGGAIGRVSGAAEAGIHRGDVDDLALGGFQPGCSASAQRSDPVRFTSSTWEKNPAPSLRRAW
jgi:hypothetical protein